MQLGGLGLRRTGHPGELFVQPEIVLQGDGGQRLVLGLDLDALFGLDRLVHALVVAATVQHPTGELVDDQHLAGHDDVVAILLVELLGLERVVQEPDQRGVHRLVQVLDAQRGFDLVDALLADPDGPLGFIHLVVDIGLEPRDQPGELGVPLRRLVGRAGDDQRRPGLVDQDRVDLVDDRVMVTTLDQIVLRPGHVVTQVVEAELVVGAVGDVGGVGRLADLRSLLGQDDADVQPEEPVHPAHPLAVPPGQVVVGGDDVHTLALEGVQIRRQGGDQGLALTGFHLGDVPEVQRRATHQLDVEVPLTESSPGGLAHDGKRLDQQVVGRLTVRDALLERRGLLAQLVVGHRDVRVFHIVDVVGDRAQTLECLRLADPEQSAKNHVFHPRSNRAAPRSGAPNIRTTVDPAGVLPGAAVDRARSWAQR